MKYKFIWKDGFIDYRNVPNPPIIYFKRFEHDRKDRKFPPLNFFEECAEHSGSTIIVSTFKLVRYYDEYGRTDYEYHET